MTSRPGWPWAIEERPRRRIARPRRDARPNARRTSSRRGRPTRCPGSWTTRRLTEAERDDGVFPLLTNDRTFDAEQVLRAYKRQPLIEKRFSQFKTDFAVAPVYLKNVARIQGLLAVYFLVLLVQTLLERELRRAMAQATSRRCRSIPRAAPARGRRRSGSSNCSSRSSVTSCDVGSEPARLR